MSTKSSHKPAFTGAGFTSGAVPASLPIDHPSWIKTFSTKHYHEFSCPTTRICHANKSYRTAPNRDGHARVSEGEDVVPARWPDQRQRLHSTRSNACAIQRARRADNLLHRTFRAGIP